MTIYLTDIDTDTKKVGRIEYLHNDDFNWYFGITENEAKKTGVMLTELPENPYNATDLYADVETQTAWYYISAEDFKTNKIAEVNNVCTQTIYNGTLVTLSNGEQQHFTLDEQDQSNLLGLVFSMSQGVTQFEWHPDDDTQECVYYSLEDFMLIMGTLDVFKKYHKTYFRSLRIYINSLDDVDEINDISYGYPLPEDFKAQVLIDLEIKMGLRNA